MFKKSKRIIYVGMLPFGAVIGVLAWLLIARRIGLLGFLGCIVLAGLVCMVVLGSLILKKDGKIHRELLSHRDNCRPDLMLQGYVQNTAKFSSKIHERTYYVNLSAAYLELGDWQAAKAALLAVPPVEKPSLNDNTMMAVQNNLCMYHMAVGEMPEAKACIDWMVEQTKRLRAVSSAMVDKHENRALYLMFLYNIALGVDEGAESYFTKTMEMDTALLSKVEKQYWLGGLYLRRGAVELARSAFGYVAQNGGTTWYAAAAQAQLQKIAS